ncbi:unnamed protein product [Strongylus vulgaris]|uniref:SCP domain-containing protein n=1 Tax=Strongylus vulgaris TaxID=40348 RepID=A0A3P7L9S6_STRVU|nr:unnamed protein product [Strongylus vulgaris]
MCDGNDMTDLVRTHMLDTHNNQRGQLALGQLVDNKRIKLPSARNMYLLVWDCDLEKQAHDWVAKCPTKKEVDKGENFYRGPANGLFTWRDMNKKVNIYFSHFHLS